MKLFKQKIRVRFAPSPTGYLHIGSARTAFFNYLFAKQNKGDFILRIEDTDKERSKPEYEEDIISSLQWLGIEWDEGISAQNSKLKAQNHNSKLKTKNYKGNYGSYRQSERTEIYKKYLQKLLDENKAYYCFCTQEELEAQKQEQESRGMASKYSGKCSTLSKKEIEENLKQKKKFVIRLKVPAKKIEVNDIVRGKIEFNADLIGDIIIAKDFENPLYNFTVVVDDYEMKITHIIRGEDLLPNTPKQIVLQEALDIKTPKYGHLPIILAPDRTKLSKRYGAVSVNEYKEQGYLPEAFLNMVAFMGWNPGKEKEIYSVKELLEDFSLEKIQKSGAIFNIQKLDFINGYYIRHKPLNKLTELCLPYLVKADFITPVFDSQEHLPNFTGYFGKEIIQNYIVSETKEKLNFSQLEKIIFIHQGRLKKISEIVDFSDFFFKEKIVFEKELLKWKQMGDSEVLISIDIIINILSKIENKNWTKNNLEKALMPEAEKQGDRGVLLWPLRVSLTGKKQSAGPFEIAEVLGKEKVINRLYNAKEMVKIEENLESRI